MPRRTTDHKAAALAEVRQALARLKFYDTKIPSTAVYLPLAMTNLRRIRRLVRLIGT